MTQPYRHLGEYSDLVGSVRKVTRLFPELTPGEPARERIRELVGYYEAEEYPQDIQSGRTWQKDGVEGVEFSWSCGFGPRTQAWYLRPAGDERRLPGILALHDHGGFKFCGKEKIADGPDQPHPYLVKWWADAYGGRAWANEMARRGFAVLVHDTFLWGSRKFALETMQGGIGNQVQGYWQRTPSEDAAPEEIAIYNDVAGQFEHVVEKYCTVLGTSMAGVVARDDRLALAVLEGLPGVDANRVGCLGLSGGGNRSALLMATAPRLRAAGIVGLMSTYAGLLDHNVLTHTWMFFPPLLSRIADWPDLAASRAPAPLLVQYDKEDNLFTMEGMQAADKRLREIYTRAGKPENFWSKFYPGPHKFDMEMQEDAFAWFAEVLKKS